MLLCDNKLGHCILISLSLLRTTLAFDSNGLKDEEMGVLVILLISGFSHGNINRKEGLPPSREPVLGPESGGETAPVWGMRHWCGDEMHVARSFRFKTMFSSNNPF